MALNPKKNRRKGAAMLFAASHLETADAKASSAGSRQIILAMALIGVSALATLIWVAMGIWLLSKLF
jgi:hypothetical protein